MSFNKGLMMLNTLIRTPSFRLKSRDVMIDVWGWPALNKIEELENESPSLYYTCITKRKEWRGKISELGHIA